MPNCEDKNCDRCDEYEIRDFWITFPYPEENSSFVPDISYMHDGRKIETEIVMSIADWSRLFKAEGIDPEGALSNSSEPLHFVKSTLVHRGWRSVVPIFLRDDGNGRVPQLQKLKPSSKPCLLQTKNTKGHRQ